MLVHEFPREWMDILFVKYPAIGRGKLVGNSGCRGKSMIFAFNRFGVTLRLMKNGKTKSQSLFFACSPEQSKT